MTRAGLRLAALWALLFAAALGAAGASQIRSTRMIAPGVRYAMMQRPREPLQIHVIELDPRERYISLACVTPGGDATRLKVSELAALACGEREYAVAGVNGDYFIMGGSGDGMLLGLNVRGGQLLCAGGGRSALVLLEGGRARVAVLQLEAWLETPSGKRVGIGALNQPRGPNGVVLYTPVYGASTRTPPSGREVVLRGVREPLEMGRVYDAAVAAATHGVGNLALWPDHVVISASGAAAESLAGLKVGDAVKLRVDLAPPLEGRIVEAVGGGPRLVRDGRVSVEWEREGFTASHALRRHPRTAAGIKPDGKVVLVAVDGRQASSVGMTLAELAQLMLELGCRDAVNLDGGGSTTMWVRGEVVNSPCGGSERPVANALLVMSSAPHGPPTRVRVTPDSIVCLPGYHVRMQVEAQDEYYNPVNLDLAGVGWACDGAIGAISPRGEFSAAAVTETATGAIKVYLGGATARVPVTVYAQPAELRVLPESIAAAPGQRVALTVQALDADGRLISFEPGAVRWEAEPSAGVVDARGVLTVGPGPAGMVTATLSGVQASARVVCATTTVSVQDFEKEWTATAFSWPRQVPVRCERVTDPVHQGKWAARLTYDFTTTTESRAAYLNVGRDAGAAVALRAWVYGDGLGHWLRGRITDGQGRSFNLDFGRVEWRGWQEVTAAIPAAAQAPIRWETIYVSEFRPERQDAGALVLDDLRAEVTGAASR